MELNKNEAPPPNTKQAVIDLEQWKIAPTDVEPPKGQELANANKVNYTTPDDSHKIKNLMYKPSQASINNFFYKSKRKGKGGCKLL